MNNSSVQLFSLARIEWSGNNDRFPSLLPNSLYYVPPLLARFIAFNSHTFSFLPLFSTRNSIRGVFKSECVHPRHSSFIFKIPKPFSNEIKGRWVSRQHHWHAYRRYHHRPDSQYRYRLPVLPPVPRKQLRQHPHWPNIWLTSSPVFSIFSKNYSLLSNFCNDHHHHLSTANRFLSDD